MTLYLSEELRWLGWIAGAEWPDGDEDKAWAVAAAWEEASHELTALVVKIDQAKQATMGAYPEGAARTEMGARYDQFRSGDHSLEQLANLMMTQYDSTFDMGTELQATKLTIIVTLCWLAIEIAWAWLFPPTAPAVEAAAIVSTRSALKFIQDAVQKTISNIARRLGAAGSQTERHFWKELAKGNPAWPTAKGWGVYGARAIEGAVVPMVINGSIQAGQIADGKRHEFNGKEFGLGALGGAAGAIPAREFGRYFGELVDHGLSKLPAKLVYNPGMGTFRGMFIGATSDAFGAVFGNLATALAAGGDFSAFSNAPGWVGKIVQGGIVGGVRGGASFNSYIPKTADGFTDVSAFRSEYWFRGQAWRIPKYEGPGLFAPSSSDGGHNGDDGGRGGGGRSGSGDGGRSGGDGGSSGGGGGGRSGGFGGDRSGGFGADRGGGIELNNLQGNSGQVGGPGGNQGGFRSDHMPQSSWFSSETSLSTAGGVLPDESWTPGSGGAVVGGTPIQGSDGAMMSGGLGGDDRNGGFGGQFGPVGGNDGLDGRYGSSPIRVRTTPDRHWGNRSRARRCRIHPRCSMFRRRPSPHTRPRLHRGNRSSRIPCRRRVSSSLPLSSPPHNPPLPSSSRRSPRSSPPGNPIPRAPYLRPGCPAMAGSRNRSGSVIRTRDRIPARCPGGSRRPTVRGTRVRTSRCRPGGSRGTRSRYCWRTFRAWTPPRSRIRSRICLCPISSPICWAARANRRRPAATIRMFHRPVTRTTRPAPAGRRHRSKASSTS